MANICKKEYEKVKGEYGNYSIGKLYVSKVSDKTKIEPVSSEKVFDIDWFNFHLYPMDDELGIYIANNINSLKQKVVKRLENNYSNLFSPNTAKKGDKLFLNKKKGNSSAVSPVFQYVCAERNNILYNINFMRFYIDKDNTVNCILAAIQFDRCCESKYVNRTAEKKCNICYPTSYKGQEKSLAKIVKKAESKNFCYNPSINFALADLTDEKKLEYIADRICVKFIKFIEQCEYQDSISSEEKVIEKKIRMAVKYFVDEKTQDYDEISFDTLLKIRNYIKTNITMEKYQKFFPAAYQFDMGITRKARDFYYNNDGCSYKIKNIGEKFYVAEYKIDNKSQWRKVKSRIECDKNYYCKKNGLYGYQYLNEIDHFFRIG